MERFDEDQFPADGKCGLRQLLEEKDVVNEEECRQDFAERSRFPSFIKNVTVEPVLLGSTLIIIMYSTLASEYVYRRIAAEYGLSGNKSSCNSSASVNKSDPHYKSEQKVSAETSEWLLYCNVAGFSASTISTLLLASWSDIVGRKIPLLMSSFGLFCLVLVYVLVVNLVLPIPVLLAGHLLCGLCGDYGTILACSFSHLSDISSERRRTLRIAVGEACIGLGGFISYICGGIWVDAKGFKEPFWFLLAVSISIFVYIAVRIQSSAVGEFVTHIKSLLRLQSIKHIWHVVKRTDDGNRRRIGILLCNLCFFIILLVMVGIRGILIVYEVGVPFCWGFTEIGISLAIFQFGYFVSLVLIKTFKGFSAEVWLMLVGIVSTITSCTTLAIAKTSWQIFLGIGFQILAFLPGPIIRSHQSLIVSKDEVGAVFALLSCSQNMGSLVASFVFNGLFAITIKTSSPGTAFFLGDLFYVVFAILYCLLVRLLRRSLQRKEENYQQMPVGGAD